MIYQEQINRLGGRLLSLFINYMPKKEVFLTGNIFYDEMKIVLKKVPEHWPEKNPIYYPFFPYILIKVTDCLPTKDTINSESIFYFTYNNRHTYLREKTYGQIWWVLKN